MINDFLLNPVLISVVVLLILSALRLNVVFSLVLASICGGAVAGMDALNTMKAFTGGLGRGAEIAFNYAMLGAFSIAISRSGVTELIARELFKRIGREEVSPRCMCCFKYFLLLILVLISISSQNLIPVHIAFIPVLIPPLLPVFEKLRLDRRMVACILTFGLITPYMFLPVGFGKIYLNTVLMGNLRANGLEVDPSLAPRAMLIPALGMVAGLLIAVFFSYRKPRDYRPAEAAGQSGSVKEIKIRNVVVGIVAIAVALTGQLWLDSLIIASVAAVMVFVIARTIHLRDTQDIFSHGIYLMGGIGIVMIAASGFAEVMKATGSVDAMVNMVADSIGDNRGMAVFLMLFIGLVITMGIGSSFSTVPLIAAIYVPLCMKMEISPLATVAIVGVAGALGDAGSPVSESVLGPTAGLNADGQHDHIYDSTIPTFLHYNLPLLAAGWLAGMIL